MRDKRDRDERQEMKVQTIKAKEGRRNEKLSVKFLVKHLKQVSAVVG